MGRVRVSRILRARAGFFLGVVTAAAGLYLLVGLGAAFLLAGLLTAGAFVWLYDVDEPEQAVPESTIRHRAPGGDW